MAKQLLPNNRQAQVYTLRCTELIVKKKKNSKKVKTLVL